jgi:SHS2 domain-containing protein
MFETFEHTANLGPRVMGDSLNDVFAEAAVGLISLIVAKVDSVDASKRRMIELNSPNLEYLEVDWLSELLFFFESGGWLTAKASIKFAGKSLRRTVQDEIFCEDRHRRSLDVKAVTYHELSILQQKRDGKSFWQAEVIVDTWMSRPGIVPSVKWQRGEHLVKPRALIGCQQRHHLRFC